MPVHFFHVPIKPLDRFPFLGKSQGQLLCELFDIRPEPDPLLLEIHTVKKIVLDHIDRLFQTVEDKTVGVEPLLPETI
jgi:hypothetical protein